MGATVFYASSNELATLTNTFSVAGVATDPTAISLTITDPTGASNTYTFAGGTVTKTGTGIYAKDVTCSLAGVWTYQWDGTGTASDTTAGTWTVQGTALSKLYCTVEELKSRLGIPDTDDDFEIRLAVDAVCRQIDEHCDRYFYRETATRTFPADGGYCVDPGDLVSVTTLKTDTAGDASFGTTWSTTDYQLRPTDSTYRAEARPYTEIHAVASLTFPVCYGTGRDDRVQVAGVFGWPAVPAAVKQAALILAAETLKLKEAPFGVAGFGDLGVVRVRDNPKAMTLLAPFRRHPILVA